MEDRPFLGNQERAGNGNHTSIIADYRDKCKEKMSSLGYPGREYLKSKVGGCNGGDHIALPSSGLPQGMYILRQ